MKRNYLILLFLLCLNQNWAQVNLKDTELSRQAIGLVNRNIIYDPSYFSIPYPNGDIPSDKGVCTDVIIRAYRKLGVDLQKELHLDMKAHFKLYPQNWGLKTTDKNIDHRRVPNLMTFFKRKGAQITPSKNAENYAPGDVVCWSLGGGLTHIGIVVNKISRDGKRPLIIHNIGGGQILSDCLFEFEIIGHYRYKVNGL